MRKFQFVLVGLVLVSVVCAQRPTYGTQVSAPWFFGMAKSYQQYSKNMPMQFQPLKFNESQALNGDDTWCDLMGEATLAETLIRNAASRGEALSSNVVLKKAVLDVGNADYVYLDYQTTTLRPPTEKRNATVSANNKSVAADVVQVLDSFLDPITGLNQYWTFYRAGFSIAKLAQAKMIQQGVVVFKHGPTPADFCRFDLTKLP